MFDPHRRPEVFTGERSTTDKNEEDSGATVVTTLLSQILSISMHEKMCPMSESINKSSQEVGYFY